MTRLILVRHGETDYNRQGRIQGWRDIELNENGRRQAEGVAGELEAEKIDAIYASPLKRALGTARIIARNHNLKVKKVPSFKELSQGKWEGLKVAEARELYKDLYHRWETNPLEVKPPEGESIKEVSGRVGNAIDEIIKNHSHETICVVAHEVINAIIKCHLKNIDLKKVWQQLPSLASKEIIEHNSPVPS